MTTAAPSDPERRAALLLAAERVGWPRLRIRPGIYVMAGDYLWTRFCERASLADVADAETALAQLEEACRKPDA